MEELQSTLWKSTRVVADAALERLHTFLIAQRITTRDLSYLPWIDGESGPRSGPVASVVIYDVTASNFTARTTFPALGSLVPDMNDLKIG